jgi:hypothetical protein
MNAIESRARELVLRWLKVPAEPQPPAGSPGSLRVFRAGHNYYRLRLWQWGLKQCLIVVGFLFWMFILDQMISVGIARTRSQDSQAERRAQGDKPRDERSAARKKKDREHRERFFRFIEGNKGWLPLIEIGALVVALLQMPFTYALVRLDYELRWYMVTDRSLRIREGLGKVREMTLSFANIQQITVHQGPLQRLLGLANVEVKTAGGGGHAASPNGESTGTEAWHSGVFRHVDNAAEIRDLMLDRLRALRDAGLGDHDDRPSVTAPTVTRASESSGTTLAAAREVLHEARVLKACLTSTR